MAVQVAPLGLRLFAEGVEIPVVSAQVIPSQGQPAAAAIQVVPTDSALMFLPRTMIHLFHLDPELTSADITLADAATKEKLESPDIERKNIDRFDVEDDRYKLLFSGEMIGYNYSKTPSSRSLVLQCLDLSSYWDTCYQWYADYSVGGDGFTDRTHNFVGAGEGLFDNVASGTRWVIGDILMSKPENPSYQDTKGLLAGYIHLLEAIGGLRPKAGSYPGFRGVNDFFSIAELRYNLTGMVGAVSSDTTSAQMFAQKSFFNWLEQGMGSCGSLISFRDALRIVGQYIYHDVYPNPAAYFARGGEKVQTTITSIYTELPAGQKVLKIANEALRILSGVGSLLSGLLGTSGFAPVPIADTSDQIDKALRLLNQANDGIRTTGTADAAGVGAQLTIALGKIQEVQRTFRSSTIVGTATTHNIAVEIANFIGNQIVDSIAPLDAVINQRIAKKKTIQKEVETSDHLYNQIILPEIYFAPPPRCNVIFPDQYMQFSYSRNFMREVSRLTLQGGPTLITRGRTDAFQITQTLAPNIKDVRGKLAQQSVYAAGTTLLPHELHSGIIPKFEWISDGQRWQVKAAASKGKTTDEGKFSYAQRLANFQFFLHRFSARQMNCVMRFNPMLVIGFPSLVIDRSTPSAAVIETLSNALGTGRAVLPTAYLGKLVNISHDVNQGGGQTQATFAYARTHRGLDDEFLGVVSRERKDLGPPTDVQIDTADLSSFSNTAPDPFQVSLLTLYLRKRLKAGIVVDGKRILAIKPSTETVFFGLNQALNLNISEAEFNLMFRFQEITESVGTAPAGPVTNMEIPKTLTVTVQEKTNLGLFVQPEGSTPPEIFLKPGWYSNVWLPDKISDAVYKPLLGCASITDDQSVGQDKEGFLGLLNQFFSETGMADTPVTVVGSGNSNIVQVGGKNIATFDLGTGTLEQSIDGLTMLYGLLKRRDLDVQQFISDYTRRPIATLPQILGSSNLAYKADGSVADPTTMIEGFHSRAFGDYNTDVKYRNTSGVASNFVGASSAPTDADGGDFVAGTDALFALIPSDQAASYRTNIANKGKILPPIPPFLDPRGRARQRVMAYAEELRVSRGLTA